MFLLTEPALRSPSFVMCSSNNCAPISLKCPFHLSFPRIFFWDTYVFLSTTSFFSRIQFCHVKQIHKEVIDRIEHGRATLEAPKYNQPAGHQRMLADRVCTAYQQSIPLLLKFLAQEKHHDLDLNFSLIGSEERLHSFLEVEIRLSSISSRKGTAFRKNGYHLFAIWLCWYSLDGFWRRNSNPQNKIIQMFWEWRSFPVRSPFRNIERWILIWLDGLLTTMMYLSKYIYHNRPRNFQDTSTLFQFRKENPEWPLKGIHQLS